MRFFRFVPALILGISAAPAAGQQPPAASVADVEQLVRGGVPTARVLTIVGERCRAFEVNGAIEARLKELGADAALVAGLKAACFRAPGPTAAEIRARDEAERAPEDIAAVAARARDGDAGAKAEYGRRLLRGEGIKENQKEAVRWFRRAADQGSDAGRYLLGFAYCSGEGVHQDLAQAAAWWGLAAEQGYASAQSALAYTMTTLLIGTVTYA